LGGNKKAVGSGRGPHGLKSFQFMRSTVDKPLPPVIVPPPPVSQRVVDSFHHFVSQTAFSHFGSPYQSPEKMSIPIFNKSGKNIGSRPRDA
jgi:hypothetical protein